MKSFDELKEKIYAINAASIGLVKMIRKEITKDQQATSSTLNSVLEQLLLLTEGIREVNSLTSTLYDKAVLDPVGIHSKQYFNESKRILKNEKNLAFIICDVDRFKQYNDTYGHSQGDVALQTIAKQFKDSIETKLLAEEGAIVARYGGEEFCALITNYCRTPNELYSWVDAIRANIESAKISWLQTRQPKDDNYQRRTITIAAGLRSDKETIEQLVDSVDNYLTKKDIQGRNKAYLRVD